MALTTDSTSALASDGFGLSHLSIAGFSLHITSRHVLDISECFRLLLIGRSDSMLSLSGRLYSLDSGSVAILPPQAEGTFVYGSQCSYTQIAFCPAANDPLDLSAQLQRLSRGLTHIRLRGTKAESMRAALMRLDELIATGQGTGKAAYARVYDLIVDLVTQSKNAVGIAVLEAKPTTRLARDIKAYLDLSFTEDITLDSLAARFFVSPSHLCRVFKSEIGRRPFAYINDLRIDRAASLLRSGLAMSKVRDICGYHSDQHFIKEFRARMDTTPGRFRLSFLSREIQ